MELSAILNGDRADSPSSNQTKRKFSSLEETGSNATQSVSIPKDNSFPYDSSGYARIAVRRPEYYIEASTKKPTRFQQPVHLTSFSYSPTRKLLVEEHDRDEALAIYKEPNLGVDLNAGFENCTWQDRLVDEGLDSLLACLAKHEGGNTSAASSAILDAVKVVTWRGMMSKLLLAVYEVEWTKQGRSDGWEMNAMVIDGVLYLEEALDPLRLARKKASETSCLKQSYYGYSFESYCTGSTTEPFHPPNTNVQWCSVVKTSLGDSRVILGGEVDCVTKEANGAQEMDTKYFIELKTNVAIGSQRDEVNFEKLKLLKHYVQSFLNLTNARIHLPPHQVLLGVPRIIVGFRTYQGVLTALQEFETLKIPRLVRGKPHAWDPRACLAAGQELLEYIVQQISQHISTQVAEEQLCNIIAGSPSSSHQDEKEANFADTLSSLSWPVFRVDFNPKGPEGDITIRRLSPAEVTDQVLAGKPSGGRVGMLPSSWVQHVIKRRRKSKT